jgi:hypothetical protein
MKLTFDRFCAAAPAGEHPDHDSVAALAPAEIVDDRRRHERCVAWAAWCRTRRFYGPPPLQASLLGRLSAKSPPLASPTGPDAPCNAELAALHLAVIAQPAELDRKVFELYYLWRVRNIKAAAAALGMSRSAWYRMLRAFRLRVCSAGDAILQANVAARQSLASFRRLGDDEQSVTRTAGAPN